LDDGTKQVIDVVDGFRLNFLGDEASGQRAFGTKKEYLTQLKGRAHRFSSSKDGERGGFFKSSQFQNKKTYL
jgi:hypothetical protein